MQQQISTLAIVTIIMALGWIGCLSDQPESSPETIDLEKLIEQGQEAFLNGQYDGALELYRKALSSKPDSASLYNRIGMALRFKYNQNQSPELKEQEIAAFKEAVRLDPKFTAAWVNLGSSYYYANRSKDSASALSKALELMPDHPDAEQIKKLITQAKETQLPRR